MCFLLVLIGIIALFILLVNRKNKNLSILSLLVTMFGTLVIVFGGLVLFTVCE